MWQFYGKFTTHRGIVHKVDVPNSNAYLNQTPTYMSSMCSSSMAPRMTMEDMYSNEIGLVDQKMITILSFIIKIVEREICTTI